MDNEVIEQEAKRLQKRAQHSRMFGWLGVAIMVATVLAMIVLFFNSNINFSIAAEPFSEPVEGILGSAQSADGDKKDNSDIEKMKLELDLKKAQIINDQQSSSLLVVAISSSVARIGAVLIALYLVQILLSLTRYHFRIADHLDSASSSLLISGGESESITALASLLATNHVEFGKAPSPPSEKILELVKEIVAAKK